MSSGWGTPGSCSTRSSERRMNSALALQLMRFGFLVLLWLFVFAAIRVIRGDLRTAGHPRVATAPPARRRGSEPVPSAPPAHRGPSHLLVTEGGLAGTRITLTGAP